MKEVVVASRRCADSSDPIQHLTAIREFLQVPLEEGVFYRLTELGPSVAADIAQLGNGGDSPELRASLKPRLLQLQQALVCFGKQLEREESLPTDTDFDQAVVDVIHCGKGLQCILRALEPQSEPQAEGSARLDAATDEIVYKVLAENSAAVRRQLRKIVAMAESWMAGPNSIGKSGGPIVCAA